MTGRGPSIDAVRLRVRPSRHDVVDIGFAAVLSALGVLGFRSSFGGSEELTVGFPAVAAGIAVGYVLAKARVQLLVGAALGVVAFFMSGGAIALRDDALVGVLPTPEVWSGLVDGLINGWVRLLTTVPPAGQAGNLLAIPYLGGFLGASLTIAAAIALPRWPVCTVPPVAVLGLTVLFGVDQPVSLLFQGALFGALVVGWVSLRSRRTSPRLVAGGRRRVLSGAVLLTVAMLGAFVVGPNLPGADAHGRYILRDRIDPPFDPSQYPSPLARWRRYDGPEPIEETLFTVDGLPGDAVVRFAVVDDYDGYVWRASPPGTATGGTYRRVGDRIPGSAQGRRAKIRFEMGALGNVDSVWIPTAGSPVSIDFTGARAETLTEEFRFNRTTETAASPVALRSGDTWTVEATFPTVPGEERLRELPVDSRVGATAPPGLNETITGRLADWSADTGSPYERVNAIRNGLIVDGAYNNGATNPVPAGHSLARLVPFLVDEQPEGNGEQYAAALAYAAESLGIPARVVIEFDPPDGDGPVEVTADHARTVVEIALADVGWVALPDPTPPKDDIPQPQSQTIEETPTNEVQPPPLTTLPPPRSLSEQQQREVAGADDEEDVGEGGGGLLGTVLRVAAVGSVPLVLIAGPALLVVLLKARRRKRRRTTGSPARRIAAGWAEVLDVARDAGMPVAPKATRREIARHLPAGGVALLAADTDAYVFGHASPSDHDAHAVWTGVDRLRVELLAPLSRSERLRSAVSLTSLRGSR